MVPHPLGCLARGIASSGDHLLRRSLGAVVAPFRRPLPILGSVAGALVLGMGFVVVPAAQRGTEPEEPARLALHVVEAGVESVPALEFVHASQLFGVDIVTGAAPTDAAEGGIAEQAPAEAPAATVAESRFALPLVSWQRVTDRFGAYRGPGMVHGGIDLDVYNYSRAPVYAACTGAVSYTGYSASYGYHVIVGCGDGWATLYGHLSAVFVVNGESTAKGATVLGRTGNTGFSTGEHLHFEIHYQGVRVNPEHYLDFGIAPGSPLSTGDPVYAASRGSSGGASSAPAAPQPPVETPASGGAGLSSTPPPTKTVPPTSAPTKTPTPVPPTPVPPTPVPTQIPIPPHGSGLSECPRTDSGAVNCGLSPFAIVCAPTGWFLDYGGNFSNPRGWRVAYADSAVGAGGVCG